MNLRLRKGGRRERRTCFAKGALPVKQEADVKNIFEKQQDGQGADAYLAEMIRRYGGLVRHICRNALGDRPEDIDECVSDAFAALWERTSRGGMDPDLRDVKRYLCGIARNKAIDRYRKLAARPLTLPLDDAEADGSAAAGALSEPDIAELIARNDQEALLADAVGSLPSPDREVFILRYYYLERVKAIADKLGMTEKAVENRLYRGKLTLRRKLSGGDASGNAAPGGGRAGNAAPEVSRQGEEQYTKKNYEVIIYG
jgi:RNA polymerase sigma-70 factor (ECF subfamily)